ncbi:hypothetical protein [Pseudomonas viridiflava]|uniref:hypothetical protein n=1 Tax=Pseudomonas viridiflava TaxID=33069 RepID=UPI0013DB7C15|nr:hypothetical protein [Pseudomonas viridiflava]
MLPFVAGADDNLLLDSGTDTFGTLFNKQAQLLNSEMDMRIRQNQNTGTAAISILANPLPGSKQEVNDREPTVEAIWGLAGKEVAEISYKGRRVPVSMQEPYISKVDGWKLESIQQYQIQLVRSDGRKVVQRKTIMLDWMGGQGSQPITSAADTAPQAVAPIAPITPAISSALIR